MVRARGSRKGYPPDVDALADVSFEVRRGEFVAVLGPSGAGKTTLSRRLTRLTQPDAGSVIVNGRDVASAGVAVVASLHQVHLATTYADRILAMRGGRVVEDAPAGAVDARAIEQIYERDGHAGADPRS